tara:strand:- start:2995 stop:3462 length:468 start_codon:yes stop_codon:yes gene_type:complete
MIKVNVLEAHADWKKILKNSPNYIKKKIQKLNKKSKLFKKKKLEFSIVLSGTKEIKILNKKFRNKNKSTDVLSFPFYEKKTLLKLMKKKNFEIYLGDIIINVKKITFKNSLKNFQKKLDKLWIHGLVHLMGGRHKTNKDFKSMNRVEKKFLNLIN